MQVPLSNAWSEGENEAKSERVNPFFKTSARLKVFFHGFFHLDQMTTKDKKNS